MIARIALLLIILGIVGLAPLLRMEESSSRALIHSPKAWPTLLPELPENAKMEIAASHSNAATISPAPFLIASGKELSHLKTIRSTELKQLCRPLSKAPSTTHPNFQSGRFGKFTDGYGIERLFNPGFILLKFSDDFEASLLQVEPGSELASLEILRERPDLTFVELDALMTRQFLPNDERLGEQWHHAMIGSSNAWAIATEAKNIKIAIVDTPFQMSHPDLKANTAPGWDIVLNKPIDADPIGFFHSTIGAGMAAAAVNNSLGVAGAVNATILPVNIDGYLSEMILAINWCAENDVRVVNLSWDGAYSSALNDAAAYHRIKTDGMVIMSGVNSRRFLDYPNQPFLYAISMTDSNDLSRSAYGRHIDFAAPGWNIHSATTNSFYENDSGSSYSAPLASGIIASLMAINPALTASEIEQILKNFSDDTGPENWDQYYGWGRLNFGAAAMAAATFVRLRVTEHGIELRTTCHEAIDYTLLTTSGIGLPWQRFTPEDVFHQDGALIYRVVNPSPQAYFQVSGAIKEMAGESSLRAH
ncbi:MAG: S8 family peptidase [Verrucomicrobiales bacterium]